MLGVLLQRAPVRCEVAYDADRRLVTWWRVVRERADDLAGMLGATPYSRVEYERAAELVETSEDELEVAWCVSVLLSQGYVPRTSGHAWRMPQPTQRRAGPAFGWSLVPYRLGPLAERVMNVGLECCDALVLLERWLGDPGALIYCDPPYVQAANEYGADTCHGEMLGLLQSSDVRARVAISGGEWCPWDELGWRRTEIEVATMFAGAGSAGVNGAEPRSERLCCNFPPVGQQSLL